MRCVWVQKRFLVKLVCYCASTKISQAGATGLSQVGTRKRLSTGGDLPFANVAPTPDRRAAPLALLAPNKRPKASRAALQKNGRQGHNIKNVRRLR